jgi:glycine/D-amino acid oxidase-like deaminating enzyme
MDRKNADMYAKAAAANSEYLQSLTTQQLLAAAPGASSDALAGVVIAGAVAIDAPLYLQGLWAACQRLDSQRATWCCARIDLSDLQSLLRPQHTASAATDATTTTANSSAGAFDSVVLAVGADVAALQQFADMPGLRLVRGQSVALSNPLYLSVAVLNGQYVVPTTVSGRAALIAGATQEHICFSDLHSSSSSSSNTSSSSGSSSSSTSGATTATSNPTDRNSEARAASERADLLTKVSTFYPAAASAEVLASTVGVRVIRDRSKWGRIPLAGRLAAVENCWVVAALGARGLIHHALIGQWLAAAVLHDDESLIPTELSAALSSSSSSSSSSNSDSSSSSSESSRSGKSNGSVRAAGAASTSTAFKTLPQ